MLNREYKNFAIKLLIFLCLLFVIDRITGVAFDKFRNYAMMVNPSFKTLKVNHVVENMDAEVIVVGASTAAMHYIPKQMSDSLGLSVYNCGIAGCYMRFQCCLINTVIDRYHPDFIIWEVGNQSLGVGHNEYERVDFLYPYYSKNNYCEEYINGIDKYQHLRMLSKLYQNNSDFDKYLQAFTDKRVFDNGFIPLLPDERHPREITQDKLINEIDPQNVNVFRRTVQRIKEEGIGLCFVQSPQYHDGKAVESESAKTLFAIANEFNVPFLHYDKTICNPVLFRDAEHMNSDGVKQYMDIIIPELKQVIKENSSENS